MSSSTIAVIGGGPGGLRAAQVVAELGGDVVLIEQRQSLGGAPIIESYSGLTPRGEPAKPQIEQMIDAVSGHEHAEIRLGRRVVGVDGDGPGFRIRLVAQSSPGGDEEVLECGAIVVATGFTHFDPGRATQPYGYWEFPDVITQAELEAMLSAKRVVRPSNGETPERVCFIQCVGSRDRQIGNEYCSKVCCGVASKEAIEIRELLPDSKVFIFYIDMRMYGYWETDIYWPAQERHHVQYVKGLITEVLAKDGRLLVRGEDTTMGRPMELLMDLVVLSVGMEPSPGTREIAGMLGLRQNRFGFIDAVAGPLDTVGTSRPGVFACGAALGPADLEDTVSSAAAAASGALGHLRRRAGSASGRGVV